MDLDPDPSEGTPAPSASAAGGPPPDLRLEIVLRDPMSGRELPLGVMASLRDLEVLASAGKHYAEEYANALRPQRQVLDRRSRAGRVGEALWDAAVLHCGIDDVPDA